MIEARRSDIVVVDKVKKETMIIDVAISGYARVYDKERETIEDFSLLKDEIARLWQMKIVDVTPIIVGALGSITTTFEKYIKSLGIEIRIEHVQKSALLGTAKIQRKVLSCYLGACFLTGFSITKRCWLLLFNVGSGVYLQLAGQQ